MPVALVTLKEVVGKIRLMIYFYILPLVRYYRKELRPVEDGQLSSRNEKIKESSIFWVLKSLENQLFIKVAQ